MTEDALNSLRRSVQSLTAELVNVYEELTLLHSLGARLGRLGAEEPMMAEAIAEAVETLKADCGWIVLWDEDDVRVEAAQGIGAADAGQWSGAALAALHFRGRKSVLSHAWAAENGLDPAGAPERLLASALASGGASRGYLCIGRRAGGPQFDSTDQKLLDAVASLVAVELENLRLRQADLEKVRLEAELDLARSMQRSLLPRDFGCCPFLEADGISLPCQQVGGDYFDLVALGDDACLLVMADVFGKGPAAALQAQMVQGLVLAASRHTRSVPAVIQTLNALLRERAAPGNYVTAFLATLERNGRLHYVNAGHNPPLWISRAAAQPLLEGGPLLGVLDDPQFQQGCAVLAPGDLLLLYTDGVSEALNPQNQTFGDRRVWDWASCRAGAAPSELVSGLVQAVAAFSAGRPNPDDLAVLAVRYTGS